MTSAGGMARAGRVKEKKKRRENRTRLIRRMRKAPFYGPQPSKCFGRRSRGRSPIPLLSSASASSCRPPLTPPAPLSRGREGRKTKESFFFTPPLPGGEEG